MDIEKRVCDVLAHSSTRVKEREALWRELATSLQVSGAQSATQNLADRANCIEQNFDATLRELTKKL